MRKTIISAFLCTIIAIFTPSIWAQNYFVLTHPATQATGQKSTQMEGLPDYILKAAINAYEWANLNHKVSNPYMLTIVDFDKPSYQKRLWVIDIHNDHIIMHLHVAQAENTGKVYAKRFSNAPGSDESSFGVFTTVGEEYYGQYGQALRIRGLEPGINDNAFARGIVIHSEWCITPHFVHIMGYLGTTRGCFAVNPKRVRRLIELVQNGSVLFVYSSQGKNDPIIDHPLSPAGDALFNDIEKKNHNPLIRFFEGL